MSSSDDPVQGLSFSDARNKVKLAIGEALESHDALLKSMHNDNFLLLHFHIILTIPSILCVIIFAVSLGLGSYDIQYPGLITTIVILGFVAILNIFVVKAILETNRIEISSRVSAILKTYSSWLDTCTTSDIGNSVSEPAVLLGYPHVSTVSCWRNGIWQRIPSLLLAEGDIIALMGGDATPGMVKELLPISRHSKEADVQNQWKIGETFGAGETIRLRRSNRNISTKSGRFQQGGYAQHSFVKHRSLPPDSIELLILSGDIRCFQMAETPIRNFCLKLMTDSDNANNSSVKQRLSLSNLTRGEMKGECNGQSFIRKLFAKIIISSLTKFLPITLVVYVMALIIRLSLFEEARTNWSLTVATPIGVIILCFLPAAFPVGLVLVEALVLGDIVATTEATLQESINGVVSGSSHEEEPLDAVNNRDRRHSESVENRSESNESDSSSSSDESSDEFLDEDIDEREEEIAEEASQRVLWIRFVQYVIHIILQRLGIQYTLRWFPFVGRVAPFLTIPMIRTRLLEVLGAVTMVCFVDDDIICEGYSVTEEIFLLANNSDNKEISSAGKGTILDLHANPEAEGSRFENPLWWKYLPNLKPVALNSLLTYTSTMSTEILRKDLTTRAGQLPTVQSTWKKRQSDFQQRRIPTEMETALVRHIRRTIPLESLKELAEEIGFIDDDTEKFTKLLELNVLAPRLGDAQLLEDTHAWGQEESRRRGTLLTHVRSIIVKDSRGGLQMMSQGDPALILKYCREYWDGTSIAPLNADDREDILKRYDRYRKEDFDVVSFAYSPIPVALQPLIFAAVQSELKGLSNTTNPYSRNTNAAEAGDVPCLLFVDPSTSNELLETKVKPTPLNTNLTGRRNASSPRFSDAPQTTNATVARDLSGAAAAVNNSVKFRSTPVSSKSQTNERLQELQYQPITDGGGQEFVDIESPVYHSDSNEDRRNALLGSPVSVSKFSPAPNFELRSQSDSNLAETLASYPEPIMLTVSESLNCETLIREMEQLDNNEDLSVLHEDGIVNVLEISPSASFVRARSQSLMPQTRIGVPTSPHNDGFPASEVFIDPATIDDSLKEPEEMPPRRRSFDEADLMDKGRSASLADEITLVRKSSSQTRISVDHALDDSVMRLLLPPRSSVDIDEDTTRPGRQVSWSSSPHDPSPIRAALEGLSAFPFDDIRQNIKESIHQSMQRLPILSSTSTGFQSDTKKRSLGAKLWPLMRQQVFLGLAASSVPVKAEVPDLLENLNSAGVRFIYFSPRNMRRSKPVAEKIGIQFDWNCAISLRPLGGQDQFDPHRYISSYSDWDIHAKMPHGVEAIKTHLQAVDNVPLLVNLYTDATPSTTCEMIDVFRSYGEVVLTIGSSLRTTNQSIFLKSDLGISVAMLPGASSHIPAAVDELLNELPTHCSKSLCQHDLLLTFRLVGLGTIPLLQLPSIIEDSKRARFRHVTIPIDSDSGEGMDELRLAAVIESIRKGRLFLLNILQAFAFLSISMFSLAMWPVIVQAVPMTVPPSLPPSLALLFLLWYLPTIAVSLVLSDTSEGVLKNTPRKSILHMKPGDERRFLGYFLLRCSFTIVGVFIQAWVTASSTFRDAHDDSWYLRMGSVIHDSVIQESVHPHNIQRQNLHGYWLVQDMTSCQLLLQLIFQAASLIERGQKLTKFPNPVQHPQFYIALLLVLVTQTWVLTVRSYLRGDFRSSSTMTHRYSKLDWINWLVLFLCPIITFLAGIFINKLDDRHYRRYLQFLRLEYDTKLGMHSPR